MAHAVDAPRCPSNRGPASPSVRTPAPPTPACRAAVSGAKPGGPLPVDPAERVLVLVLRCLAAAGETGDAVCWDEALDRAEQAFGPRDGSLVVARAAALHRSLAHGGPTPRFLPLPCRDMSGGEAELLLLVRASVGDPTGLGGEGPSPPFDLSPETRRALADVAAAVRPDRRAVLALRTAAGVTRQFEEILNCDRERF